MTFVINYSYLHKNCQDCYKFINYFFFNKLIYIIVLLLINIAFDII